MAINGITTDRSRATFKSLTGANVTVDIPAGIALGPWTSFAVYEIDGVEREFTSGVLELGRQVAAELGFEFSEQFSYQQGQILYAAGFDVFEDNISGISFSSEHALGVWEGRSYSVHFHLFNSATSGDVVDLMSRFEFRESSIGIWMRPQEGRGRLSRTRRPAALVEAQGLGVLDIRPHTATSRSTAPKWSGTPVFGGEAFCQLSEDDGPIYLKLLSADSDMTILPDLHSAENRSRTEQSLLEFVHTVSASWMPSAG